MQTNLQLTSQLQPLLLIGSDVGYAGVHTQAEICVPKCVLGRCVHAVVLHIDTSPFLAQLKAFRFAITNHPIVIGIISIGCIIVDRC